MQVVKSVSEVGTLISGLLGLVGNLLALVVLFRYYLGPEERHPPAILDSILVLRHIRLLYPSPYIHVLIYIHML
jgi:hypothetical protein